MSNLKENEISCFDKGLFFFSKIIRFFTKLSYYLEKYQKYKIYKISRIIIILINTILLPFYSDLELSNPIYYIIEILFVILYFINFSIKQISFGLFKHKNGYFNDLWNIFEFSQLIIGIICTMPKMRKNKYICWFRGLRPFTLIYHIPQLNLIFSSVLMSLKEMINVFILLLFIFLSYSILAVNIWSGIYYRRCRINPIPINGSFEIISNSKTLCGGLNQCNNCYSIYDFHLNDTYFLTQDVNSELRIDELNYGYSTFDNFIKAFLTIYNCMTLNGWSKIMYMVQNGYSYSGSTIFFVSLVIILNYLVLNFTIAILMDNIEKNMNKDNNCKIKIKLIDFEAEGNKILLNETYNFINNFKYFFKFIRSFKLFKHVIPKYVHHSQYKITYYCYIISQQPIWDYITYIIIIINIILLSNINDIHSELKLIIDHFIIIIFGLDCTLKLFGMGFKNYFTETSNLFDLITAIVVIIEFIITRTTVLSVIYLLKTLNIIKGLKDFKQFNVMIELLSKTIQNILLFFLLIFLLVYVFAIIGITLFKGVFDDTKTEIPSKNFESIINSLKEVFSLLIGDDWYIDMIIFLNLNKINNIAVYIYFIFTNIFLSLLIMNLVIAFLVYHYDVSRKKQRFEELSEIIRNGEKSIGLKRSGSFSFTMKKIRVREMLENKFLNFLDDIQDDSSFDNSNLINNDIELLNKSDLFDYKIENDIFGEKNGVHKFKHDINTDKIISKDDFGFGIIMKKLKKEKAIQIFNEQIQKREKNKKKNNLSTFNISSMNKNTSEVIFNIKEEKTKRESTKDLITNNFFTKKKGIHEFKIVIGEQENESKNLDQMFLNAGVEKDILLNLINKQSGRSFVCPSDNITKDFKSTSLIGNDEKETTKRRRTSTFQKAQTFFNHYFKKNDKLKNIKNEDKQIIRNKSSSQIIPTLHINQTTITNRKFKNYNIEKTKSNSKFISLITNSHKIKNTIRRIVFINNNIFNFIKNNRFSILDIEKIKSSKFYNYISQSSLFIFHRNSKIRKFCIVLIELKTFRYFFVSLTAISSIFLMLNTPYLNPRSKLKTFFYYSEGFFIYLFSAETIIKIIANGLILKDDIGKIQKLTVNRLLEISDSSSEHFSNSSSQLMLSKKTSNLLFKRLTKSIENSPPSLNNNKNENNNEMNKNQISENEIKNDDESVISSNSRISQKSIYSSSSSCKKSLNNSSNNNIKNSNMKKLLRKRSSISNFQKINSIMKKENDNNKITVPYLHSIINSIDLIALIIHFYLFIKIKKDYKKKKIRYKYKGIFNLLCLRPLRMISDFTSLRQMFIVLILSIPSVLYVLLITLIIFFIYAIVGINYFKGLLGNCSNENYKTKKICEKNNFLWIPQEENFDTISSSILTLYELATTSGWYEIMDDIDYKTNNLSVIYFVSFMIIGSIFMMNFSVTCVIDTFVALREKMEGDAFLTSNQKEWVKAVKMFMKFKPVPTVNVNSNKIKKIRKICYNIAINKFFIKFINCMIILNIIIMCFSHLGQTDVFTDIQTEIFNFSTIIFISEMIIKLIAYKSLFFIDSMNIFDFIVVICSSISVIFSIINNYFKGKKHFNYYSAIPGLEKGIRVLRVFRLINLNSAIKNYLKILLFIMPQFLNIFTLLLMFIVIFIILGINLFSTIKYGQIINDNVNFKDILSSMTTLIRVLTGDQWNDIMHELAINQVNCTNEEQTYEDLTLNGPNGCGTWSSYPYFIFFMILNSTIIINMFIAVIVGTFMEENVDSNGNEISTREIEEFYNLWSKYDPNIKYSIDINRFILFMTELKFPMGLQGDRLFDNDINKHKLKGKIYFSPDKKTVIDEEQVSIISEKLGIKINKNGEIHILDVIKLVNKRYIIAQQENDEDLQSLEKYRKELKLFDIKQKKVGLKLKEEFTRYHKGYEFSHIMKKNTTKNPNSASNLNKSAMSPVRIKKVPTEPNRLKFKDE